MQFNVVVIDRGERRSEIASFPSIEQALSHYQQQGLVVEDIASLPPIGAEQGAAEPAPGTAPGTDAVEPPVPSGPKAEKKLPVILLKALCFFLLAAAFAVAQVTMVGAVAGPNAFLLFSCPLIYSLVTLVPPVWRRGFSLWPRLAGLLTAIAVSLLFGVAAPLGLALAGQDQLDLPVTLLQILWVASGLVVLVGGTWLSVLVMDHLRGRRAEQAAWSAETARRRPAVMRLCLILMAAALAVGTINYAINYDEMVSRMGAATPVVNIWSFLLASLIYGLFLMIRLYQGDSVFRFIYQVGFMVGAPLSLYNLYKNFNGNYSDLLFQVVAMALNGVVVYLILTEPARSWFRDAASRRLG